MRATSGGSLERPPPSQRASWEFPMRKFMPAVGSHVTVGPAIAPIIRARTQMLATAAIRKLTAPRQRRSGGRASATTVPATRGSAAVQTHSATPAATPPRLAIASLRCR